MSRPWSRRIRGADVTLDLEADFDRVIKELKADEDDVRKAMSRALRRTATTLRVMSSKRVVPELQLRKAGDFRKRLKQMRTRIKRNHGEVGIWVGLNDMGVSKFKGRASEYAGGAKFRDHEFPGAFVAKSQEGRRSIFRRKHESRFPLVEQTLPIKDRADVILEDEVLPDAVDIFMKHFVADLRARTLYGVGKEWNGRRNR
ncbi:phage tail protein [Paracoccus aestuariivivens]|uniref:Phage tail protein n=1 Tax=Paracoccus aestuariivivens TaxID=1820333 RepID=A0A6L6JDE0_9RHOB|nr:phage tail protein [Paracoccus aestuariivivens]MTH78749.1 phage tail protein [Paracoccus aestuariivivens]